MFIAVISAILLILLKNPIHSIFSLLISIISSICVLLLIKVEFLAYVFLIVYVGAIAILFLFVIMMLNIKVSNDTLIDYSS
jgi:NADH-quinone oxidoreductase subunit J